MNKKDSADILFTKLINKISQQKFVLAILLVGSKAKGNSTKDSDYDLHIVTNIDIPTFTLHYSIPLKMDITCYFIENIYKLHIDRKLEIKEAKIIYQKDFNIPSLKNFNLNRNEEATLHWIRFHLRHLREDILKSVNEAENILNKIRFLYHACVYKYFLTNGHFRGFKRLKWRANDEQNFLKCLKEIEGENQNFFNSINTFIGIAQLKRLNFAPYEYEIETQDEFESVKNHKILKILNSIIFEPK